MFREFRKTLKTLGDRLSAFDDPIDIGRLKECLESVDKGVPGLSGGNLTRMWLELCSPRATYLEFIEWVENSGNTEDGEVVVEFNISNDVFRKYQGWLITTGSTFSANWQVLRTKLTSVATYFGLSRSGVQFFHSLGYLSPLTTLDRYKVASGKTTNKNVSLALTSPHILWIDNYSKIYGDRFFSNDERPYSLPLWTAYAVRPLLHTSRSILERCINAMPVDPFGELDKMLHLMTELDSIKMETMKPHDCERIRMRNVPPGPGLSDGLEAAAYWKDRMDTSMKTLIPWKIESRNVAANETLDQILVDQVAASDANPKWILADINIFSRILRTIYDKRKYPVIPNWNISLGLWHTYKQAIHKVYQSFGLHFFAPFFHYRYPKDKFKPKPKFLTQPESLIVAIVVLNEYAAKFQEVGLREDLSYNVIDYGMRIKKGFGTGHIQEQMKILKLLVLCGDVVYAKAVGRSIMIHLHQRRNSETSSWSYLTEKNINLMNEEIGEISLSILQRAMLRSSYRRDQKSVSDKYQNVTSTINNMNPHMATMSTRFARERGNNRRQIDLATNETIRMKEYFDRMLLLMNGDEVDVYESVKGYTSREAGLNTITPKLKINPKYGNATGRLKLLMGREKKAWDKHMRSEPRVPIPPEKPDDDNDTVDESCIEVEEVIDDVDEDVSEGSVTSIATEKGGKSEQSSASDDDQPLGFWPRDVKRRK